MRNIYESRHYKLYILIPVLLMLASIYFMTKIQLDSTLRGGVSIQLQTSQTINVRALTGMINANITGAQASVSPAVDGVAITLTENESLSAAQAYLLDVYGAYSNYSASSVNLTEYQQALKSQPANSTLIALEATASRQSNSSVMQLNKSLALEFLTLKPIIGAVHYNNSNYASAVSIAQGAYSNASAAYESSVISKLRRMVKFSSYSYNEVTPTLGAFFLLQMRNIIIASLIVVAIAVFFIFRTPIPSFAVVFGAANDMIVALGVMGLLGIPLGIASVGGLLMLLGYSIDTDMLSSIRVLKRSESTPEQRAFSSFKTGTTMTLTAILSFSVLLIVAYVAYIPTYIEISSVVLAGLVADLLTTWLGNMPMILWYKKRKESR